MISTYPWKDASKFFIPGILVLASVAIPAYAQQLAAYSSESLFMAIFANGDALVEYDISLKAPASEVTVKLFGGSHISDLVVVDYENKLVDYKIGSSPNEIVLKTPGVSNIRISYTTPDLVNRIQGVWTFSLNTTAPFSVRLPPNSVLADYDPTPRIQTNNNQPLLIFDKPANVRISYATGVIGTLDQANISIQLANVAIKETRDQYPDINLTEALDLVQKAIVARDNGKFAEAESQATKANDLAVATGKDYSAAKTAITNASDQVQQATKEGRDVASATKLLDQARGEFAAGTYAAAKSTSEDAVKAIGDIRSSPQIPFSVIIAGGAAAAGGVGALVFLKMKKQSAVNLRAKVQAKDSMGNTMKVVRPSPVQDEKMDAHLQVQEPLPEEDKSLAGTIPESQIDKSVLATIVARVLEERPHLRPEDQLVLKFLAEKEGAAFESEIRTKFQLPKTTIWRLVKRLEREELVEIRKAGGQNLIKLKFEDKIP